MGSSRSIGQLQFFGELQLSASTVCVWAASKKEAAKASSALLLGSLQTLIPKQDKLSCLRCSLLLIAALNLE